MATFTLFDEFIFHLGTNEINLSTDTFKIALSNVAPVAATNVQLSDITQITAQNGYVAGGNALTAVSWEETGAGLGVWRFISADVVFTASGGSIGPFRYAVLYSDTAINDELVGFLDNGASITVLDGNSFTVNVGVNGYMLFSEV